MASIIGEFLEYRSLQYTIYTNGTHGMAGTGND